MEMSSEKNTLKPTRVLKENHVKETLKLDKGEEASLVSWKTEDFGNTADGFVCYITRVKVRFLFQGAEQNTSYVIKIRPGFSSDQFRVSGNEQCIKEAMFYKKIVPELNSALEEIGQEHLRAPKCFNYINEIDGQHIHFFEDLTVRGFKMHEKSEPMQLDSTLLVINELARLHSASILSQQKFSLGVPDRHPFIKVDWLTFEKDGFDFWDKFTSIHHLKCIAALKHIGGYDNAINFLAEKRKAPVCDLEKMFRSSPPFNVICHGDVWNNNVLFRYDNNGNPVEVMLLDFQMVRYGSLSLDLNQFLYTSMAGKTRCQNITYILETYFGIMKNILEAGGSHIPFTLEELRREFIAKHHYGISTISYALPMVSANPDIEEFLDTQKSDQENMSQAVVLLQKNHEYKERFLAVFDEMGENGAFQE